MSRETKFRAWDKENEEYINGYEVLLRYDGFALSRYALVTFDTDMPVNVIIEQYTGLKDKNGEEIYEGDIVSVSGVACTDDSSMACIIDTNSVVIWDEKYARFDVNDDPEDDDLDYRRRRYSLFTDGERSSVEVIGNIHENPELLGGEE